MNDTVISQLTSPTDGASVVQQEVVSPSQENITSSMDLGMIGIIFFSLVAISGIIYLIGLKVRKNNLEDKAKDWVLFEVMVPKENEIEIGVAEQMFANLSGIGGDDRGFLGKLFGVKNAISFEIVALPESIKFYVYCPRDLAGWVERQVLGSYQDAEFKQVDEYSIFPDEGNVSFTSLILTDESYNPLKTAENFEGDPLANITSALTNVEKGEGVAIQLVMTPAGGKWQKSGRSFVGKVEENNSDPEKKKITVSQDQLQVISKKCSKAGFKCALRVVAVSKDEATAKMHLNNVVGAFDQFSNPGINELKRDKISPLNERDFMKSFIYRYPAQKDSLILNVEEIAAIYHFPNKNVQTPHIHWLLSREAPADSMVPSEGTWLGTAKFRGQSKEVFIKEDDRMRHLYAVGQTGSGKSYVLQSMAIQDAYAGNGFAFIDPHGSSAEYVLSRIPHERAEDVIYFNPSDFDRPMGFNIMDFYDEQDKHRVVNAFLALLQKMFDPNNQGFTGPVFEQAVRNSMLTVMSKKGSTLVEVMRALTDDEWVKREWLPILKDDVVRRYWEDQVAKTSDFHKSEKLGYIVSKFDRFVTNIAMRNIIGQSESSFDLRDIMDNKKILIVNLAKGLMGEENAQFLGLLLVPKILSSALSRENVPEEQRTPFYMYVDEFQTFATKDFASILSEARKYKLSLSVGNQYISQMPDEVKDAVFGNVGTLLAMRVGSEDGKYLETHFEPVFTAADLINQPNIHACMKLLVDGKYPPPFSISTKYEDSKYPENKEVAALIKQISRVKYGRDKEIVEAEIARRANLAKDPGKEVKTPSIPGLMSR
ncbi:MAG: type IV secretory system conjugative DNA transfer family protein [bacterium]